MSKQLQIEFICDRCFTSTPEDIHMRTGSTVYIGDPTDKRRSKKYDLCAECTSALRDQFLTAVDLAAVAKQ